MDKRSKHFKSKLNVVAIAFAVLFSVLTTQTSALAAQPMVAAGVYHTVGLKSDGTVVAVGYNADGQLNVSSWTNIVQVGCW